MSAIIDPNSIVITITLRRNGTADIAQNPVNSMTPLVLSHALMRVAAGIVGTEAKNQVESFNKMGEGLIKNGHLKGIV